MYFSKENKYEIFWNWNIIHFPWTHTFLDVFRKFYWLLLKSFKFNIKEFALSTFIEGFEIKIYEILGWYKNTNDSLFVWLSVIIQDCWRVWLKSLWKRKQKSCWLNAFKVYWSVRNRAHEIDILNQTFALGFELDISKTTPSMSKFTRYCGHLNFFYSATIIEMVLQFHIIDHDFQKIILYDILLTKFTSILSPMKKCRL